MATAKEDESKLALRMYEEAEEADIDRNFLNMKETLSNILKGECGGYSSEVRKAEEEYEKKVKAMKSGKVLPPVSYDDGDQSPLYTKNEEFHILVKLMSSVWRLEDPLDPSCTHLSSWLRCICFGNFQIFMHHLAGKSEEELEPASSFVIWLNSHK